MNAFDGIFNGGYVALLEHAGPQLGFPYSSAIRGSRYGHLRELRVQHAGRPYRVLYAFDPRRAAVLLFGGDKSGDQRWYTRSIRMAEEIYSKHLRHLEAAGPAKP